MAFYCSHRSDNLIPYDNPSCCVHIEQIRLCLWPFVLLYWHSLKHKQWMKFLYENCIVGLSTSCCSCRPWKNRSGKRCEKHWRREEKPSWKSVKSTWNERTIYTVCSKTRVLHQLGSFPILCTGQESRTWGYSKFCFLTFLLWHMEISVPKFLPLTKQDDVQPV